MTTETLKSSDGTAIHVIRAMAAEPARGDILLCHGANEYMGRYTHVIEALNGAGYNVHGMDLRGHGHSGGRRGHVQRWVHYSEDMRTVAQSIGKPLVILAHSMGGLVTLECMREGINGQIGDVVTQVNDLSDQIATCVSRVDLEAANLLAINHQKIGNCQGRQNG